MKISDFGREEEHASEEDQSSESSEDEDELGNQIEDEILIANLLRTQMAVADANLARENEADEDNPIPEPPSESRIESIKICQEFISQLSSATLDNGKLDAPTLDRLRNPVEGNYDISDKDTRLSLDLFLATDNASDAVYNYVRDAIHRHSPNIHVLSLYHIKELASEITSVVSIPDKMCINSCVAFTGPYSDLEACPVCAEPSYDPLEFAESGKKIARKEACTFLLGPQLQALRRGKEGSEALGYRDKKTKAVFEALDNMTAEEFVYDDIFTGSEYIGLAERLDLTSDDMVVSFSLDGAQLYQNKKSDTWIGIWIVGEYDPTSRFKKIRILPALIIPGPNKPKNSDSFLFRSFHHFSALQREQGGRGFRSWDGLKEAVISSRLILAFATADALGLVELDGRVGHHGRHGCRFGCEMQGRHKPNSGHYFAAHLCPSKNTIEDCNHPDVDLRTLTRLSPEQYQEQLSIVVNSLDQNEYEKNRKETGISKPSILSGLVSDYTFPIPSCFTIDIMHLFCLNIGDLLVQLWRGELKIDLEADKKTDWTWATLVGDVWTQHGQLVAAATPYFPSSFHRPPRNPAEKINSGYKASKFFLYLFGLGPGFFRAILPIKYWVNFCKLVRGVRILTQRSITGAQVVEAQSCLVQFLEEYENIYYQHCLYRLHFCRPVLHTIAAHGPSEVIRAGPGVYSSQYAMERTVGDLGQGIRQPSNPFSNLSARAMRRCQQNSLKALYPELDPTSNISLPKHALDTGNGFIFLQPRDRNTVTLSDDKAYQILLQQLGMSRVRRWGRLRLPNGQVARSLFSENKRTSIKKRNTRNVKV